MALGADSKAVQSDLCGAWIHANCEGFSDDIYDKMNAVIGGLNNFVYYCETNNCISRIKQILYGYFTSDRMGSVQPQLTEQQDGLSKQINDFSQKIADLSAKQQLLQQSVQTISSQIVESTSHMDTNTTQNTTPRNAFDIIDEMSDRERRKQNMVVPVQLS